MKNIINVVVLFTSFIAFSQQTSIKGLVKDAITNEPVMFASVAIKNTSVGTITNEEGVFAITYPNIQQIVISSIGYKTLEIKASEFTDQNNTAVLEPEDIKLEEVVVSNVPVYETLQKVVASSLAKFDKQIVVKTYYREFETDNGKVTKFADGLLDYYIDRTGRKTKSDLVVTQNRSVQLFSEDDEEIFKDVNSDLNVQDGVTRGDFVFIKYIIKNHEKYTWHLKSTGGSANLMTITFDPKEELKKVLFEGFVTYDAETGLIYNFEIGLAQSHIQYATGINLGLNLKVLDARSKATYKLVNGTYILSNISRYQKFRLWTKRKVDETLEFESNLVVTDFSTKDLTYNKDQRYNKSQLYKKPTSYSDKFWQGNNAIVLTEKELAIIQSLEDVTPKGTVN